MAEKKRRQATLRKKAEKGGRRRKKSEEEKKKIGNGTTGRRKKRMISTCLFRRFCYTFGTPLTPSAHSPPPGSNLDSAPCSTSGADWPPCSPFGRPVSSSSADAEGCAGPDGTIRCNADTCVFCTDSSMGPPFHPNDRRFPAPWRKKTATSNLAEKGGRRRRKS